MGKRRPESAVKLRREDELDRDLLQKIERELPLPFTDTTMGGATAVGVVTVHSFGTIPADKALRPNGKSWCAQSAVVLAPIGFKSERKYKTKAGPERTCSCEVALEGDTLKFIASDGKKVCTGSTANEAWGKLADVWDRPNIRNEDRGAPKFGVGIEGVQHIMALLPNAIALCDGPFHRFKETRKEQREEALKVFQRACELRRIINSGAKVNPRDFFEVPKGRRTLWGAEHSSGASKRAKF